MSGSSSLYVRMTDGRDRGRVVDMVRDTALEMIDKGQAVLVDPGQPGALDFIPDFRLPRAEDLSPQTQLRQVESLSQNRPPEVPTVLAGTFGRKRRNN